jgi:hypothetical protein
MNFDFPRRTISAVSRFRTRLEANRNRTCRQRAQRRCTAPNGPRGLGLPAGPELVLIESLLCTDFQSSVPGAKQEMTTPGSVVNVRVYQTMGCPVGFGPPRNGSRIASGRTGYHTPSIWTS